MRAAPQLAATNPAAMCHMRGGFARISWAAPRLQLAVHAVLRRPRAVGARARVTAEAAGSLAVLLGRHALTA